MANITTISNLACSHNGANQTTRIFKYSFFALLLAYLTFIGQVNLPSAHYFLDAVAMRDTGITISTVFSWSLRGLFSLFCVAMDHVEGPLQYLIVNFYCHLIGDHFPLNPSLMQIPNTVFSFVTTIFAYLLGRKLHSYKMGYCCAIAFALSPWLIACMRVPWYFNTLSNLLQFAILYFYVSFMIDPTSKLHKIAAPVSLSLYFLTGVDWPIFLIAFALMVVMSTRLTDVLRNIYNIFPLFIVMIHIAWLIFLFIGDDNYGHSILVHPFRLSLGYYFAPIRHILGFTISGWGLQAFLATGALLLYINRERKRLLHRGVTQCILLSMTVWFALAGFSIVKTSLNPQYVYVVGVPTAFLAGMGLAKMKRILVLALIAIMVSSQFLLLSLYKERAPYFTNYFPEGQDGRHVMAAAGFLIENRPDLLTDDKTAFLPRNIAPNVSQYARGQHRTVIMPQNFPELRHRIGFGSGTDILLNFVDAYQKEGTIQADWLILDSNLFSKNAPAREFWLRLRNDPGIQWISAFRESSGNILYIGEVKKGKWPSIKEIPFYDTELLSATYEKRYDRISFLKRNISYLPHY